MLTAFRDAGNIASRFVPASCPAAAAAGPPMTYLMWQRGKLPHELYCRGIETIATIGRVWRWGSSLYTAASTWKDEAGTRHGAQDTGVSEDCEPAMAPPGSSAPGWKLFGAARLHCPRYA